MTVDKASTRSIRLTAVDGDQIRVFLLMVRDPARSFPRRLMF